MFDAQYLHFLALIGTLDKQCGHCFSVGSGFDSSFLSLFICLIIMNIAKAIITKSTTVFINNP
jgi:hypothetical protein